MPQDDHCCVPGCTNRRDKYPTISFHSFPKEEPLRSRWVHLVGRDEGKNFVISSSTVVCGHHFEEDCVFPSVGSDEGKEATAKRSYCRLKPGSVPTLFWFRPSPMHRSSPAEQKATSDERAKQLKMQKNLLVYGPPTNVTCLCEKLAASERRSEELERALEDSKKECKTLRSQQLRFKNVCKDNAQ